MTETIELKQFLRTGNFGEFKEIHFGIMRDKLIEILGDTEWIHFTSRKSKFPSIYKYGKVEFYFEEGKEGRLCGIQILPTIREAALVNLKISYDFINTHLKYEPVLKQLEAESINYQLVKFEYDSDDVRRIETEGGVQIIFSEDFGQSISIQKISKFIHLKSKQPKEKQVSFSIPEPLYQQLKDLGVIERKSIANICKEIILNTPFAKLQKVW